MLYSGVVNEDVNSSEPFSRRGDHRRNLLEIGEISFMVTDIDIVAVAEAFAKRFNFVAVAETIEHHVTALFGEGGRDRVSNTRSCTRYDGCFFP